MGLAASQARYLSLRARQSNIEYQGQQINQERSILSQQVTELYNSLLDLQVPTPPSTSEFTKVQYSGNDGATPFVLGNIKPQGENFIIEFEYTTSGGVVEKDYTKYKVEKEDNIVTKIGDSEAVYEFGAEALGWDDATKKNYEDAISNTFGQKNSESSITPDKFYVIVTRSGSGECQYSFALKTDVDNNDEWAEVYTYTTGTYIKTEAISNCSLEFDTTGRITSVGKPIYTGEGENKELTGLQYLSLTASESIDQNAYDDAYAEYEYEQYLYDKKQAEINAKTELIQQQDRSLELKLTRLDNERKQLDTEADAVKKVLEDNIDKTFKTFNG